ncbi:MAG TPA: hypothetical protein P5137_02070, partial [Candidatus Brocadiia bacterium]|nr:hypothetical protein [Candidatus Brocadiia bacterium]
MSRVATSWEMFPQKPSLGKYLWGWVERYGLTGEGYAPTSMAGHHFITKAALDVLPDVRDWLGGEADLMIWAYCGFPDMNWPHYGGFLDEYPHLAGVRMPDYRRAWEISRYCQFNPVTKRGKFIGHGPPTSWAAFALHYGRAVRAMELGRKWDAIRILGMALHYLEDSGAPPH